MISLLNRIKAIIRGLMMHVKMLFAFALRFTTILADVIITLSHLSFELLPSCASIIRYTASPIWMILPAVFYTAECEIAFPTAKMMSAFSPTVKPDWSPAAFTRDYRYRQIKTTRLTSDMVGIALCRAPSATLNILPIDNISFPASFANLSSHTGIIT